MLHELVGWMDEEIDGWVSGRMGGCVNKGINGRMQHAQKEGWLEG